MYKTIRSWSWSRSRNSDLRLCGARAGVGAERNIFSSTTLIITLSYTIQEEIVMSFELIFV
jgi:hypothetical protein